MTQRGNRREPIFFEDGDQDVYCDMLAEQMRLHAVKVWAYCLMPNHVHLILVPSTADGLGRAAACLEKGNVASRRSYHSRVNASGVPRFMHSDSCIAHFFALVNIDPNETVASYRIVPFRFKTMRSVTHGPVST
jgi:putative transposase